jgi:hypothetical protein
MKVQVIRKPLSYGRKKHAVGDTIEMSSRDARLFRVAKRVIDAPIVDADTDIPAAPVAPITVNEGEFDHPGLDAAADASDLLGEEEKPAKPKRTYKRRDLQAE